jgi:hypothetical protein
MAGPIIDSHTHPLVHSGQQFLPWEHTAEEYLTRVQGLGVHG